MIIPKLSRLLVLALAFVSSVAIAQRIEGPVVTDSLEMRKLLVKQYFDSIDKTINYQEGKIAIKDIALLNMPAGYKFVPADKTKMILHDLWGNPERDDVLGMVVANDYKLSNLGDWTFIISYDEDGYVKDEDADKINYDDLLKQMQESEVEINKERAKGGYPEIHLEGWAAKPFYDKDNKVLHWAKRLQFAGEEDLTLNYDVRILGRKGVLSMNAIGGIEELDDINKHIPDIVKMATFTDGNQYKDFNSSIDKVAAYTIGGLIAGKLIAKTGLLLLLLKNIKLILLAFFGGFAAFRNKIVAFFSRNKKKEPTDAVPVRSALDEALAAEETDNNITSLPAPEDTATTTVTDTEPKE